MPTKFWGATRRRWLGTQRFADRLKQAAFDDYLHAVDLADRRIEALEAEIAAAAANGPWADLVARLR